MHVYMYILLINLSIHRSIDGAYTYFILYSMHAWKPCTVGSRLDLNELIKDTLYNSYVYIYVYILYIYIYI